MFMDGDAFIWRLFLAILWSHGFKFNFLLVYQVTGEGWVDIEYKYGAQIKWLLCLFATS